LYKKRHLIENFSSRLKGFRAIATRYEKTSRNFLAGICLAAAIIWLDWEHTLSHRASLTPIRTRPVPSGS
jgi:hypothetical protein